jgi:transposase
MIATTRLETSVSEPRLFVAFELGKKEWKLALTAGFAARPWVKGVPSGDMRAVARLVAAARTRFGLPATARVVSCYEAGRDGFWIHRALVALGVDNHVVDSASIEVNRRARRAKTDRLDAVKLVRMLVRVWCGERGVWRAVRVPTTTDEAARQVSRERTALVQERTRLRNQLRSWLTLQGAVLPAARPDGWWTRVRDWAGQPLPVTLQARIARAEARGALLATQIATLDAEQRASIAGAAPASAARRLVQLKGVAATSARVLLEEGLLWRAFRNRREIGGWLGFAPTPYNSGDSEREQGISRAGNARVQAVAVQLAWSWVHWQPTSVLTHWFVTRFGRGTRARRIGIVALARRLLIALWRCATTGAVPTGAIVKTA